MRMDWSRPPTRTGPYPPARTSSAIAGEPPAVLGDELLEGVEPDGEHEHVGPVDGFVDAHRFRVAVEVGRELPGDLLITPGRSCSCALVPGSR